MGKLKITLKKSKIGKIENHIKNIETLGLKKVGDFVEKEDTPAVRGILRKVAFMVDVEEVR